MCIACVHACVRVSMEASVCELVKSEDTNAIDSLFALLFDHYLILQLLQMNCFYSCSDLHRSPLRIFMLNQLFFSWPLPSLSVGLSPTS